jgi:hypothetical protein
LHPLGVKIVKNHVVAVGLQGPDSRLGDGLIEALFVWVRQDYQYFHA